MDEVKPSGMLLEHEMSKNDRYALKLMQDSKRLIDGHYQLSLPWRPGAPSLKSNYPQALQRLKHLQNRFEKNANLKQLYVQEVEEYVSKGYARKLEERELADSTDCWYLPHHPVFNVNKPNRVRVVFDCAARSGGMSLNSELLRGPDFLNSLVGVLCRFRKEKIAIVSDVRAMYHQVKVDPKDQKYLRFLWWPGGDTSLTPVQYSMQVHIFGATSSPSCACFALLQTAEDNSTSFAEEVVRTVRENFYMDDCLKSVPDVQQAIEITKQISLLLKKGGFHLNKWMSNNKSILSQVPPEDVSKSMLNFSESGTEGYERVLGVLWNFVTDQFSFRVKMTSKPFTRRGVLSMISSLFDPLGFAAPVIMKAKIFLQELCKEGLGWDEEMSTEEQAIWREWTADLASLGNLSIPRCILSPEATSNNVLKQELHHFADASTLGYGAVSYYRTIESNGNVQCCFLFGKARLAPIKTLSIPRLELTAAVLAVKIDQILKTEMSFQSLPSFFWTDSTAVLHMIHNTSKRFPTFVANRLTKIEEQSEPCQWKYVDTNRNPADQASRGISPSSLHTDCTWLKGPDFLYSSEEFWPEPPCTFPSMPPEFSVLKKTVAATSIEGSMVSLEDRFARISTWHKLRKVVAWILRLKNRLLKSKSNKTGPLTVEEIERAETAIISNTQACAFADDLARLSTNVSNVVKSSCLRKLTPILFEGILRVGRRIDRAAVPFDTKHPIILPSVHHITRLIIESHHREVGHAGMSDLDKLATKVLGFTRCCYC